MFGPVDVRRALSSLLAAGVETDGNRFQRRLLLLLAWVGVAKS